MIWLVTLLHSDWWRRQFCSIQSCEFGAPCVNVGCSS